MCVKRELSTVPVTGPPVEQGALGTSGRSTTPIPVTMRVGDPTREVEVNLHPEQSLDFPTLGTPVERPVDTLLVTRPYVAKL